MSTLLLWLQARFGLVSKRQLLVDRLVAVVILTFSWWLMSATFSYQDQTLVLASKVWSDFGAHVPLVRSFSLGANFPPEYPQFPNEPIRYHYLFYALVGLLEAAGLQIDLAMNIPSALGMSLLLWMVYVYAKQLAKSVHAGLIAVVLVLLNGSLSWWYFTQKFLQTAEFSTAFKLLTDWFNAMVSQHNFAVFGPWDGGIISAFWTLNIFTNQRHLALSFGLILWLVWPLVRVSLLGERLSPESWSSRFSRLFILMIFPLLHQAGWLIVLGMVGGLVVSDSKHIRKHWPLIKTYVIGLILSAIIFFGLVPINKSGVSWHVWFLVREKTFAGIWQYWWQNIGLYVPLSMLFLLWPQRGRWLAWLAGGLLLVTNLWQLSPDMINNHKLVNFALILLAIVTSVWLVNMWRGLSILETLHIAWLSRVIIFLKCSLVGLLFLLIFGGIVDFFPINNDHKLFLADWQKVPVAKWLKENTSPDSVILPTEFFYHPASLAGRKIFLDYGYFAWSLGYADRERRDVLPLLFGQFTSHAQWCGVTRAQGIDYVVIGPHAKVIDDTIFIADSFVVTRLLPAVVTDDGYKIYSVKDECQQ